MTRDETVTTFLRLVGKGRIDEVRRILAEAPVMVNAVGPHPFWGGRAQPLHVAIETRRRDLFDLLLEAGADVNGANDQYDYWSPLMLAINRRRTDMSDTLIARGARVGLVEALMLGDDRKVEALLRPGASAFPDPAPNGSLLNFARTPFAIDRLMALGVSPTGADRWGASPIESFSRLGPGGRSLVRHLAERGVPAGPTEYARVGDQDSLAAIVARDPSAARSDAVLMGAVDFGHHAMVEWLLARGANVDARANGATRHTALHSAAWNGDLAMVQLLVAAGADRTTRDDQHHGTPREWAEVATDIENNPRCRDVVEYLGSLD